MCLRNVSGYPHNYGYPLTEITFQDFKQILLPNFLKQIKYVNFNGNLGDFGVAQDADKILHYTADYVTEIQIETNGGMRTEKWWANLARDNVEVIFALDGVEDTHSLYRIGTTYNKVLSNALAFIKNGGNATWKMIEFEHNKHQIQEAHDLSKELGFKKFQLIDNTSRVECAVFKTNGEFDYWIGNNNPPRDAIAPFEIDIDPISDFNTHINTIQNQISPIHCIDHISCAKIYIAGDGTVYPCCFTGIFPLTMQHPGNTQLKEIIYENNAITHGLEHSIQWFNNLYDLWDKTNIKDGKPLICLDNCSAQP